jgi:hypothetical protein
MYGEMSFTECKFCDKMVSQPCTNMWCPKHNYKIGETIRIRYPADFVINDTVKLHLNKERKMTREETLVKLPKYRNYGEDAINGWLIDALEVLGLIKFDEAPPEQDNRIALYVYKSDGVQAWKLKQALEELGYEVKKK